MKTTTLAPVGPLTIHNCDEQELRDPRLEWDGTAGWYNKDDLKDLIFAFGESDFRVEAIRESSDGTYFDENDSDLEWETLLEELTAWMKEVTPKDACYGSWQGYMRNFGWLHQNGEKQFRAEDGQHLLWAIFPNTDCHFNIYRCEDATGRAGLAINNRHHDTGPGGEWYYIFPESEIEDSDDYR